MPDPTPQGLVVPRGLRGSSLCIKVPGGMEVGVHLEAGVKETGRETGQWSWRSQQGPSSGSILEAMPGVVDFVLRGKRGHDRF